MQKPKFGTTEQPFPEKRPEIRVEPSSSELFKVTISQITGFGVPMEIGAEAWMAWYDPPSWSLTSVTYQNTIRACEVHGLEGLEIESRDWESDKPKWREGMTFFARLTEENLQWLAVSRFVGEKRVLYTLLDEGFDKDWGEVPRHIEDTGRLKEGPNGLILKVSSDEIDAIFGAGMFDVTVGNNTQTCLRCIDIQLLSDRKSMEQAILVESYYTREGKLFFHRRYNGRLWGTGSGSIFEGKSWDERFPENAKMVINGSMFVHWYDCLTDISVPLGK